MNFFKKVVPFALGFILMAGSAFAQGQQINSDNVTKQELENFVAAANQVRGIQRKAQMKVQKMIQDEGLKPQRFRMIMMSKQNPKMADSVNVTQEEEKAYENIEPKLKQVNQKTLQQFQTVIQNHDLTRKRFQQIAMAIRSDKDLQQRIQKIQAEEMKSDSTEDKG